MVEVREHEGKSFAYQDFMEQEGIPIHRELVGVEDVTVLPRAPWARTGGRGTFVELHGTFQCERGIYVGEIPGGAALEPAKHLYEEEIFILEGRGSTQVWQGSGEKISFEWGPGSVFALPRCSWYRLFNGGRDPVIYLGVTTAPAVMNTLDNLDFVFECDYPFIDLYQDGESYFKPSDLKTTEGKYRQVIWHTNMIPNSLATAVDDGKYKVAGGQMTGYRMGKRFPHGHISEWPAGLYHKAHYHGPGAILLGLDGEGYVLAWDSKLGPRPYQNGHGDEVIRVNWRQNSIYSPPDAYYHQHFNSGAGPARHIAVYGATLPMGVHGMMTPSDGWKGLMSTREGGTLIEYEDEDPQIRKDFEAAIGKHGIPCKMPVVQYR
jgi:mannose-6-phosphate isomerase-like protein (cupin superfamily)